MTAQRRKWISWILVALALILAWYLRGVLLYFLLGAIVSFLGNPLVDLIEQFFEQRKRNIPRALPALVVLLAMIGSLFFIAKLIIPALSEQFYTISNISSEDLNKSLQAPLDQLKSVFVSIGADPALLSPENIKNQIADMANIDNVKSALSGLLSTASSLLATLFSVAFIAFFFMKEKFLVVKTTLLFTPENQQEKMDRTIRSLKPLLTSYFRGILLQILVFGTYIFIGLSILGEKYALTVALFSGIINLIPYVGPFLAIATAILFSVCNNLGADFYLVILPEIYHVGLVFAIAILLDNFVSYPLIFSKSLRVHPLELFFVILAGGQLAGITGMLVAAPSYTVLRVIAKEFLSGFHIIENITRKIDQ